MDTTFRRKLIKLAIAAPLSYSVALVSDISTGASFMAPLMVFITLFYMSGSVSAKKNSLLNSFWVFSVLYFLGAFIAGLWGVQSVIIFLALLIMGWGVKTFLSNAALGMLPICSFQMINVLTSSTPYTSAVDDMLLLGIGMGSGWLVEFLFWPLTNKRSLEQQIRLTFQVLQELSDIAFYSTEPGNGGTDQLIQALEKKATGSIQATHGLLKSATSDGSVAPSSQDCWAQVIALQARLVTQLVALYRLFQENRQNPFLRELDPELSTLEQGLSAAFTDLSETAFQSVSVQQDRVGLNLQPWQNRIQELRVTGLTRSFDLPTRLSVALIDQRLGGLHKDLAETFLWKETYLTVETSGVSVGRELAQ